MQYDRSKQDWVDHPEQIFLIVGESILLEGSPDEAHTTRGGAEAALNYRFKKEPEQREIVEITLHRPSLRAVYGGPTLIEALWNEMDAIMERLMTGQANEDGGDKYRAEELAWVLAIVTNAYDPSVDRIRAETMARWNAAQAEAAGGSTLNSEDQD
jgi:hypothetical protein